MPTTFAEATAITPIDSHTYSAHFREDWCIGKVPNGGYVTSCFLKVAGAHFSTTLAGQDQPDPINVHMEFLRRTQVGPAKFTVKDVKLGRQTSTIHISLYQDDNPKEEVVAYITNSNIKKEQGPSLNTGWSLDPPPYPVDLEKLKKGNDENWMAIPAMPFSEFRKASQRFEFNLARAGPHLKSMADEWVRFTSGERITNDALGFACDMFPMVLENYRFGEDPRQVPTVKEMLAKQEKNKFGAFWYPTLSLNLDIKKALPEEGVEYLFVRVRTKQVRNGRFDLEVVLMDDTGDVVALSNHVTMVLDASRNTAQRRKPAADGSKL